MQTVQLNPIVANRGSGMDIFDLEAERQANAIRLQNSMRPAKKFFKRTPVATPTAILNKI